MGEKAKGEGSEGHSDQANPEMRKKKQRKAVTELTLSELRKELSSLKIFAKGTKEELQQRLKKARSSRDAQAQKEKPKNSDSNASSSSSSTHNRNQNSHQHQNLKSVTQIENEIQALKGSKPNSQNAKPQNFDYFLVFDVEATCVADRSFDYPNEIIEFPIVMINSGTLEIEDEFHSYVKPTINPILSQFCINLTGIHQETVDASPSFVEVLRLFEVWLARHKLFSEKSCVFVTDGPWDIRDFIRKQCSHSSIPIPNYFQKWVNLRMLFHNFYEIDTKMNLSRMLHHLGMQFEGREHSGISDSRNIARILIKLIQDGSVVKPNNKLQLI